MMNKGDFMIDEKQLDNQLHRYLLNVLDTQFFFILYKEIKLNAGTKNDKVNNYPYCFQTIVASLQYTFIMSLNRLLDITENKNLFKLISMCRTNQNKFNDKDELLEKLNQFENYLKNKDNLIKEVKLLRDKIYAHFDRCYFTKPDELFKNINTTYDDIEKTLLECFIHIKGIYENLNSFPVHDWEKEIKKEVNVILGKI